MRKHPNSVWIPLDPSDVPCLESLLARTGPFVTSGIQVPDPYHLASYVGARLDGMTIGALLDRNLTSRAVHLALGATVPLEDRDDSPYRITAATMAFLITADAVLEPNISLYEGADQPSAWANNDLAWFRIADNVRPQAYLDIALRRETLIPEAIREEARRCGSCPEPAINFRTALHAWRLHQCALTKMVLLARDQALSGPQRLRRLIDWSIEEAYFDGAVTTFASLYFGRRQTQGLLKHARARDPKRCLAGIRNAAWDLTYVTEWVHRTKRAGEAWLFCTMDRPLAAVCRVLVSADDAASAHEALGQLVREKCSSLDAAELNAYIQECMDENARCTSRGRIIQERFPKLEAMTAALQAELLETV